MQKSLPQEHTGGPNAADTPISYFRPPELEELMSSVSSHQFAMAAAGDKSSPACVLDWSVASYLKLSSSLMPCAKHEWGNPAELWGLYTFQTFLLCLHCWLFFTSQHSRCQRDEGSAVFSLTLSPADSQCCFSLSPTTYTLMCLLPSSSPFESPDSLSLSQCPVMTNQLTAQI